MASALFFLDLKGKVGNQLPRDCSKHAISRKHLPIRDVYANMECTTLDPSGPQLPRGHPYVRGREIPHPPQ